MTPIFQWTCSYLKRQDFRVTDETGTYMAEIRSGVTDYEDKIANGDDVRREMREAVGILRRSHIRSTQDITFEVPAATVDAFNAWRLAEHNRFIANMEAQPRRYGPIPAGDPIRKPPLVAVQGRFENGRWVKAQTKQQQEAA